MIRPRWCAALALVAAVCLVPHGARSQTAKAKGPRLEPVAENKLLMNGLAEPNFKGLGKMLATKPKDDEAWEFARGRALLIAETGNLLMIRPPRAKEPQNLWMNQGTELRDAAVILARAAAAKDYVKARAALAGVANVCNRCHKSAGVPNRVQPFPEEEKE
jgi:hypothetical protein